MLFSCLVDADRIDTASAVRSHEAPPPAPLAPGERLKRLLSYIEQRASAVAEGPVKQARREVLEACLLAAQREENLFSLTVPTGGAKTLASMAFALRRAELLPEQIRRIIVVIPYLAIIEQNAQVFIDALGQDAILEHHSGDFERLKPQDDRFVPQEEDENEYRSPGLRQATENWDAPVIVTTSVRFFESLFSNRPADLRRMHNIARSVVVLDEVQTLPRKYLTPVLSMMKTLAGEWETTFVFCTATQPAFEKRAPGDSNDPRWEPGTIQEIMPDPGKVFGVLKRTHVEWLGGAAKPWSEIAAEMKQHGRALCIVNTRDQATALFSELKRLSGSTIRIFHLSTRMCAAHRLETLAAIRQRLAQRDRECLVVSTQLVEAGVDLDFPEVYRAMGPLDSIAQAAGRCDREGQLTLAAGSPAGRVVVFETEDGKLPPGVYREATDRTRALAAEGRASIHDPEAIREYFHRLYSEADSGQELQRLRGQHFRRLAAEFVLIADHTQAVIVPYDDLSRRLMARLREMRHLDRRLLRRLQRFIIGLYPGEWLTARRGAIGEVCHGSNLWFCNDGFYDPEIGIVLDPPASRLVI
jgi:CRISPR-associated endonuclease/helicase Cas3